jgi:hypothetical protein
MVSSHFLLEHLRVTIITVTHFYYTIPSLGVLSVRDYLKAPLIFTGQNSISFLFYAK